MLLPQTELLILWVIQDAGGPGVYGLDIQRAISECSAGAETISVGTLYSLLKRLRERGYIEAKEGPAANGGAFRQYCSLTTEGHSAVQEIEDFFSKLQRWQGG